MGLGFRVQGFMGTLTTAGVPLQAAGSGRVVVQGFMVTLIMAGVPLQAAASGRVVVQ